MNIQTVTAHFMHRGKALLCISPRLPRCPASSFVLILYGSMNTMHSVEWGDADEART